jgi:hypothetical protein
MGLLDDAIREHLDLKRRRGADPTEIERAEREALGPVRRGPEVTGDDAPQQESAVEPEAGAEAAPAQQWEPFHDEAEPHEPGPRPQDHEESLGYEPEDHVASDTPPIAPAPPFDLETDLEPPHPTDVAPAHDPEPDLPPQPAAAPPAAGSSHLEQETEEYELEPEEHEEEGDDDVLESTPEFLQDTPDHDRLWFEQRPPKDFDFDG